MRVLIFVRTAIIFFFKVSTCYGTTSNIRRDDKDKSLFNDTNEEARGNELVDYLSQPAVHIIDLNLEKAIEIQELTRKLENELMRQRRVDLKEITRHARWRDMEQKVSEWLKEPRVHPKDVFMFLNLQSIFHRGMDPVTLGHDPTLLVWFYYIDRYRTKDTMGSNNALFNNKELLYLLAEHFQPRPSSKLTFPLHDPSVYDPYSQAVTLFDYYRRKEVFTQFAEDMLTYMVTNSITKDFVLKEWLLHKESPEFMFYLLRLEEKHALIGSNDLTLFTAWLEYVEILWKVDKWKFDLGSFIFFILPEMSLPRAKVMFDSNALENVLGDVNDYGESLAAKARKSWHRYPEITFKRLKIFNKKITPDNSVAFANGIATVAFYAKSTPFNGDQMYDLLKSEHSFDEVVNLFRDLELAAQHIGSLNEGQRSDVENYAHSMVQYLADPSSMLHLPDREEHPEVTLNELISQHANVSVIKSWFPAFVAYYRRMEKREVEDAIYSAVRLLHSKLPYTGDSDISWLAIVGELQNDDARIKPAFESVQHMARELDKSD